MNHELMITEYEAHKCACYYEEGRLTELNVLPPASILGNIYVGRVQNIVKNLDAAFVEVQPGVVCFYSLTDNKHIFLNQKRTEDVTIGDELLVQVTKEAIKTKAPLVSSDLHLTGNLVVVTLGVRMVGVSKKLPNDEKISQLKATLFERLPEGYGVIIRTNAYEKKREEVELEFERLLVQMMDIVEHAACHKAFSCLYQERSPLMQLLDDYTGQAFTRIITDLPDVYENLEEYEEQHPDVQLQLYETEFQPLYAIYRLDRDWKEVTGKRVWLNSGAYLVIEQTEAMVVIDVNTGKAINRNRKQQHLKKVNMEAADEIVRQLRLRNLSGIIMIDFIDMENPENREGLIEHLCKQLRQDRIPTNYIDMTRLNLVELTRKKVRKSLSEQIGQKN